MQVMVDDVEEIDDEMHQIIDMLFIQMLLIADDDEVDFVRIILTVLQNDENDEID